MTCGLPPPNICLQTDIIMFRMRLVFSLSDGALSAHWTISLNASKPGLTGRGTVVEDGLLDATDAATVGFLEADGT